MGENRWFLHMCRKTISNGSEGKQGPLTQLACHQKNKTARRRSLKESRDQEKKGGRSTEAGSQPQRQKKGDALVNRWFASILISIPFVDIFWGGRGNEKWKRCRMENPPALETKKKLCSKPKQFSVPAKPPGLPRSLPSTDPGRGEACSPARCPPTCHRHHRQRGDFDPSDSSKIRRRKFRSRSLDGFYIRSHWFNIYRRYNLEIADPMKCSQIW